MLRQHLWQEIIKVIQPMEPMECLKMQKIRKYRFVGGGGTTMLFDSYNYTIKNTDVCGSLTTQSQVGKCGVFLVAEQRKDKTVSTQTRLV